ncbi:hypothetical protein KSD_12580 [Ktedonobacter sp. SOSP1-85]|nr:hypothetical protein KSD_12580 [Ktedonobacter sp. SOSP1-85]
MFLNEFWGLIYMRKGEDELQNPFKFYKLSNREIYVYVCASKERAAGLEWPSMKRF